MSISDFPYQISENIISHGNQIDMIYVTAELNVCKSH